MAEKLATDVLVIGGGCAAVRAAVEAAGNGVSVTLVDKGQFEASGSSPPSLTGLASTIGKGDSPEVLFSDIIKDGYSLSDQNLAWAAAQGALGNIRQLETLGFVFRKLDGDYYISRGVGHSVPRGLIFDHNVCGMNPVAMLGKEAWRRGVRLCDHTMIVKLLKQDNSITGALGISRDGRGYLFQAKAVVLAAGGANNLYPNPCLQIAAPKYRTTGDAFCLAFDASVPLIDLEFPNFREGEGGATLPNIGAWLLNARNERIMETYAPEMLERAPRGKLVEAIYRENQAGRGPVYWQLPGSTDEAHQGTLNHLRHLYGQKLEVTIDYQRLLGGAHINERTETPVAGLYAAGESAGGFHGADRMQSACFLEVTFFGARAGINAAHYAQERDYTRFDVRQADEQLARFKRLQGHINPEEVIATVQNIMWEGVGILRNATAIERALAAILELREGKIPRLNTGDIFAALEAANLTLTAEMVARAALMREESRGTHLRSDYHHQDDKNWLKHIAIQNKDGKMVLDTLPVVILPKQESARNW